jgi:hypothetical protein
MTGQITKFIHAGDPVTRQGWLDSSPSDRRFLMSSGPFKLAVGDTQEVVGAKIIAPGVSPSKSVAALRFFDVFAQSAFDLGFEIFDAPSPKVAVRRLDREILLTWLEDHEAVESFTLGNYAFQGYRVYQGGSASGPFKPIATFDVVDNVQNISDLQIDETNGLLVEKLIIEANDTGIQRHLAITTDAIFNPGQRLSNYRDYYFAVTSYFVNLAAVPKVVVSPVRAIRIAPSALDYGVAITTQPGANINMAHPQGSAEGEFYCQVVDPMSIPTAAYRVTWNNDSTPEAGAYTWNLDRNGERVLWKQPIGSRDIEGKASRDAPIVDGLQIQILPATFKFPTKIQSWFPASGLHFWMLNLMDDHRASTFFGGGSRDVAQLQADLEFRFSGITVDGTNESAVIGGGQLAIFRSRDAAAVRGLVRIPFELWDVENNVQINVFLIENNADGLAPWGNDGQPRYFRTRGRPYIIPIHTLYDPMTLTKNSFDETVPNATWVLFFDSGERPEFPASAWSKGSRCVAHFTNPLIPGLDELIFSTTAAVVTGQTELAKSQLQRINIVPNPYWAHNPMEREPQQHLVRITNLPGHGAKIRIFTLAGDLVRVIDDADRRTDGTSGLQYVNWDLRNDHGYPVGSGVYLIHVEVPGVGVVVKKAAIIIPQEQVDIF